jgi:hypothetical protein
VITDKEFVRIWKRNTILGACRKCRQLSKSRGVAYGLGDFVDQLIEGRERGLDLPSKGRKVPPGTTVEEHVAMLRGAVENVPADDREDTFRLILSEQGIPPTMAN